MTKDISIFAEKVNAFRKSRKNRTEKFPIELKREAVSLLKKYGYSQICNACTIGDSTLYKWKKKLEIAEQKTTNARTTPTSTDKKKSSAIALQHTRLDSLDLAEEDANHNDFSCQFKCENVHFYTNDPVFLARTLQILQRKIEVCL